MIAKESDHLNRVWMAYYLAKLGDQAGRDVLKSECHINSNWESIKVIAATNMINLDDYSCVDSLLDILRLISDPQDTGSKAEAIELVPRFLRRLDDANSQRVNEYLEAALEDPAPTVRISASRMLGQLGVVPAIPKFQAAIAKEQDPMIRDIMKTELSGLQHRKN